MKKLLALLLASLTLVALVSCAEGKPADAAQTSAAPSETVSQTEVVTEPPRDTLVLPELDFKGYSYRVLSCDKTGYALTTTFDFEEMSGEVVEDALYQRNRAIEDLLNVKFEASAKSYSECGSTLTSTVGAGEDAFDMIMLISRAAYKAALEGYLRNYDTLPYIDTDRDYYYGEVNEQITVGGRQFYAYSAECINLLEWTSVVIFNKQIAENFGYGDLYDRVRNGSWLYDTMFETAIKASADLDGDGVMTFGKDRFAMAGPQDWCYPALWVCAGEKLIDKDKDDNPYYAALKSERFLEIMMKYIGKIHSEDGFHMDESSSSANMAAIVSAFSANNLAYSVLSIGDLIKLRDMKDDFGIVPYPKYDDSQETYVSHCIDGWLHVVPATVKNAECAGAVLQSLAYYTYKDVYPAYYDKALSYKYLRDNDSVEMLDIIRSTLTMDLGDVQWFDSMRNPMSATFRAGSTEIASMLASYENVANKLIEDAIAYAKEVQK